MDSKRQQKYAKLIQKDLSEIFQRDARHLFDGAFVTVTTVRVSPDLGLAKVYLSFMLSKEPQKILEKIQKEVKPIRKMLGDKMRKQARIIPELAFFYDDSPDYASKMDSIISNIGIPPKKDDEEENEDEKIN